MPARTVSLSASVLAVWGLLVGCASTATTGGDGSVTRRYAGFVELTERHTAGATQVERVRGVGLRVSNGFLLGGFDDRVVSLPADCRLVVLVKTEEQLQQWARWVKQSRDSEETSSCVRLLDF